MGRYTVFALIFQMTLCA